MNSLRLKAIALALATFQVSALAAADPNLSPNPQIEMLRELAGQDALTCKAVTVSAPVNFRSRKLVEIPDITEPDLRLANQLMSAGCFARAVTKLDAVLRADPGNRNAHYIVARMTWMRLGTGAAERELQRTLSEYQDFVSAKVLLAGLRFEQERIEAAGRLLNEVEQKSPTDLWIYMNRLRLEALRSPSRDLRARLLEIIRDPAFPPNARESAARSARSLPNQTPQEFEEVLTARLDIDSSVGMACKAADLAFFLSESQKRYADVIKLLESPRSTAGDCLGLEMNRVLLAQAYLMQAANISAGPGAANKTLVDKASALLNGDFTGLASHVAGRPQEAKLEPFLADLSGETKLCRAIGQFAFVTVAMELAAGADPNGTCHDVSLVGSLVYMETTENPNERRAMMSSLLARGAPLTKRELEACRKSQDCSQVLLPTMEGYSSRAK